MDKKGYLEMTPEQKAEENFRTAEDRKPAAMPGYKQEDVEKLIIYILNWWEEHRCDTTGEYGELSVYDDEPSFVTKAKTMKKRCL